MVRRNNPPAPAWLPGRTVRPRRADSRERGLPGPFVGDDAPLVQEERFRPALPIIRYTDLEQAIAWANGVGVGLGASVWSADRDRAKEIAARLEAGTVWVNGHGGIHPMVPFGGAKHSGYGLEFGVEGLKSVSVPQVISGLFASLVKPRIRGSCCAGDPGQAGSWDRG